MNSKEKTLKMYQRKHDKAMIGLTASTEFQQKLKKEGKQPSDEQNRCLQKAVLRAYRLEAKVKSLS